MVPKIKAIMHTDRGTQFSSECYNKFIKQFEKFVQPSMSRENTPTDNAVAERYMRTFKEHKIEGKTIEQALQEIVLTSNNANANAKIFRSILNKFFKSLNRTPNNKSLIKNPEKHDKDVSTASLFMVEPKYPKAFSEHIREDSRRSEIIKYKDENSRVVSLLEEIAAKKAEIVDRTPFDSLDDNLALELIDKRLTELYSLIEANQLTIKNALDKSLEKNLKPVNEGIEEIQEQLDEEMEILNKKIDKLLPKIKKGREIQPLRDPIDVNLFPVFLLNAGSSHKRQKDLRTAQLRITYTILYHTGLRINEIRHLTLEDIYKARDAAQFSVVHHKTKKAHIHVLSRQAIQDLQNIKTELEIVFEKYQFNCLFGKEKPITDKNLIKLVNRDLKETCKQFNIPFNVKSHSFRINMVTNLLKVTSVQHAANIIGHDDIRSTMKYNRYAMSKTEIQDLLNQINSDKY
jgi:integrase/recombinase XerD